MRGGLNPFLPGGMGVLPYKRLMGCATGWGDTFSDFLR